MIPMKLTQRGGEDSYDNGSSTDDKASVTSASDYDLAPKMDEAHAEHSLALSRVLYLQFLIPQTWVEQYWRGSNSLVYGGF